MDVNNEITVTAELFQQQCHKHVEAVLSTSKKVVSYQDATNTWLFYKLAELQQQIQELKK
jgi:hypothetical protein